METSQDYFEQIRESLKKTKEDVFNGELSNLDGLLLMRNIKEQAESVLEIVKDFETERIDNISNEAKDYPKGYRGYLITETQGRKTYSFKGIEEVEEKESEKKMIEIKYKSAFEGFQKGIIQTTEVDGIRYWIDENGELKPFPELNIGKSFLTIRKTKP